MYGTALYLRDVPALIADRRDFRLPRVAVLKLASLAELFCYPDYAIEVLEAAQEAGIVDLCEAAVLIGDLRIKAPTAAGGWRAVVPRAVRALLPPKLRRRLMRVVQGLVEE